MLLTSIPAKSPPQRGGNDIIDRDLIQRSDLLGAVHYVAARQLRRTQIRRPGTRSRRPSDRSVPHRGISPHRKYSVGSSTRNPLPPRSHAETISPRWPTGHRVAISREIWPLLGSRDLWHCEPPRPADVLLVSGMARAICLNSLAFPQPITKRDGPCRCSAAIRMADTTSGVVGDPVSGSMTGYRLEGITAEDPDRSRSAASAA